MSESELQRAIEALLLETGASRAVLQLQRKEGGHAIVAEAVQHDQSQIRQRGSAADRDALAQGFDDGRGPSILVQDSLASSAGGAGPHGVTAQMRAPLIRDGRLIGVVALHHCAGPRQWSAGDQEALRQAQSRIMTTLTTDEPAPGEELATAAIQAILDRLRLALDAQRCTFRQPVQESFAFPVTFESRNARERSLLGDFTIVQTGQPVIVKLLAERAQVIQEDCATASPDPLFRKMLAHYGGMRAQMVTPFIVGGQLKGVLSVHELRHTRCWTQDEKRWAAEAAALIGAIAELPQP